MEKRIKEVLLNIFLKPIEKLSFKDINRSLDFLFSYYCSKDYIGSDVKYFNILEKIALSASLFPIMGMIIYNTNIFNNFEVYKIYLIISLAVVFLVLTKIVIRNNNLGLYPKLIEHAINSNNERKINLIQKKLELPIYLKNEFLYNFILTDLSLGLTEEEVSNQISEAKEFIENKASKENKRKHTQAIKIFVSQYFVLVILEYLIIISALITGFYTCYQFLTNNINETAINMIVNNISFVTILCIIYLFSSKFILKVSLKVKNYKVIVSNIIKEEKVNGY